jgi:hypothetical protein
MKNWLREEWPVAAALVLWVGYLASQIASMQGAISFASDDAYLRLAIARNLALTGTWGIHPGEFASTVGTLIWPLLLAGLDWIVGAHKTAPLFLNAALSCALVVCLDRIARRIFSNLWLRFFAIVLAVAILPLAPLTMEGMEHVLQLVLIAVLLESLLRVQNQARGGGTGVIITALLLTATRYEGILVVALAAVGLAAVSRKHAPLALAALLAGALPIVLYAWISYRYGWMPVPNDVYFRRAPLMPDSLSGVGSLLLRPLDLLNQDAALRALVLAPLVGLVWGAYVNAPTEPRHRMGYRLWVLLGTVAVHLFFIGVREARYDAYLILIGWWAVLPCVETVWAQFKNEKLPLFSVAGAAFGLLAVLLLFPLINRGISETTSWWQARSDFRELQLAAVSAQQRESATASIATDFPGVFAYAGFRVVDLTGMANLDLSRARRMGGIRTADIAQEIDAQHITRVVVADPAVRMLLPAEWPTIREIQLPDPAGGYREIYFFDVR